jgi:hypothetical protein
MSDRVKTNAKKYLGEGGKKNPCEENYSIMPACLPIINDTAIKTSAKFMIFNLSSNQYICGI